MAASNSHQESSSSSAGAASYESYLPPPGPPPESHYAPPPGPPPSHSSYLPPSGPPPSHAADVPPPGPPPSYASYAPPPGPPPSQVDGNVDEAPYHDWTSVPDTSLLPPPPTLGHDRSATSNASLDEAQRAHAWCRQHALFPPHQPTQEQHTRVRAGDISLQQPREFHGTLKRLGLGHWTGNSRPGSSDSCILSSLPLYFATTDTPTQTQRACTVYFEVKIVRLGRGRGADESSLAIGYCAVPYPAWRMPGWERGSVAVHADDGCRYVNDTDGGKDFVSPIRAGETVGLGITYTLPEPGANGLRGEAFLTRAGYRVGGWSLQEEIDAESAQSEFGIVGLDGRYDLYAAVGTFGEVSFEVMLNRKDWLWQPR